MSIALIADLLACILVYQKFISKYEANPIPSQPKNITSKLSADISISMKNVNNDRIPKKRP
jgi:hypothetical protein